MSENPTITELTPEQQALIPVSKDKWLNIARSTQRIDKYKAAESVKAAYKLINEPEPKIFFFDSIFSAINEYNDNDDLICFGLNDNLFQKLRFPLILDFEKIPEWEFYNLNRIRNSSVKDPQNYFEGELLDKLIIDLENEIYNSLEEQWDLTYFDLLESIDEEKFIPMDTQRKYIKYDLLIAECSYYDFCISVLNYPHDEQRWQILQNVVKNCPWFFPFQGICFICDRPIKLSFNQENRLYGDGEPAIEHADGYKVYANSGVLLPEKYGTIPTSEWKSQWLLEERNAELRRVLVHEVGFNRIYEELGAEELDSWKEYNLLKINNYIEVDEWESQDANEPMHLLKMTCPSTGHIHFLRVPPNINSAREGIRWVNWGFDPEEFAVQT
ncbi:hypothetical protein NIES267_06060 [Calothrix parasitica NIES-267]|uniref:DUF6745 domain-containing protein n=1 Tax=Calothrix parasitica NIES-267 TaxID=1973488 RepID=A0A1Z4LIT6_9CYAN|nr:hypothetical protein NIES267_06060 [Calothrix parasitica NIES-267]